MRFFYWLVIALLALVFGVFAVSNRAGVTLTLWPLAAELAAPLYLVVLLALLAGFLGGLLVGWIFSWRARWTSRERARRIEALERDLTAAEHRAKQSATVLIPHS